MKMLRLLLIGAVALASGTAMAADMPAAPVYKAPPQPALQPSGYIELYTGWNRSSETFCDPFGCDSNSNRGWLIGGAGRANWWLNPAWSVQLDAQGEGTQFQLDTFGCPDCPDKASTHAYLIASHATWRDAQRGGIGAFGAVGDMSPGVRFGLIGPEGLVNWDAFTFYLQGGYGSTIGRNEILDANADGWFARGTARYYPTPNLLLEGTVLGAWVNFSPFFFDPSYGSTSVFWRLKAEAMISPYFSVFAAYQGSRTSFDPFPGESERLTDDRVMLGLRAWINRDNLRNNDITGAPFDVINPLGFTSRFAVQVSDIRLKRDVALVGHLDNGLGLYSYRYLWSDQVYVGVMAQEVEKVVPEAVLHGTDGYLRVNYSRLGAHLLTWDEWAGSKAERLAHAN